MPQVHWIAIAVLSIILPSAPAMANDTGHNQARQHPVTAASPPLEFAAGTLGICQLYQLSGYLALDASGQVVPLNQYCQQQRNWVWYDSSEFWRQFRRVATPETLAFTQNLNPSRVEAYARSICEFLASGRTQQELQQLQADRQLPLYFEQTVTATAIKTYCRQYRSAH